MKFRMMIGLIVVPALTACMQLYGASASSFCVRSRERAGLTFPQAAAQCDPYTGGRAPSLLDLSGAEDLQAQAIESGYYAESITRKYSSTMQAAATREVAMRNALVIAEHKRSEEQNGLSPTSASCIHAAEALPDGAAPTGALTPLERKCIALGQAHESVAHHDFPGLLPDGANAQYLGDGSWRVNY